MAQQVALLDAVPGGGAALSSSTNRTGSPGVMMARSLKALGSGPTQKR
jgi:hypothetical protein